MTDAQIISISITVLAILAGSLNNNARISDMAGRFTDLNTHINSRFGDVNRRIDDSAALLRAEMNLQFERTNNKIDSVLKLLADMDQRVSSLESRK